MCTWKVCDSLQGSVYLFLCVCNERPKVVWLSSWLREVQIGCADKLAEGTVSRLTGASIKPERN